MSVENLILKTKTIFYIQFAFVRTATNGRPAKELLLTAKTILICPVQFMTGITGFNKLYFNPVLWIRIRSDPELFLGSGSGSGIICFGSGSGQKTKL